jgi:AcrR family transcriptional regulator
MPAAERAAQRRRMLVEAAFDILGSRGSSAMTVRAVIEKADLNVRYFYESFDDLDGLLLAVYDRVVEDLGVVVIAALESAGRDPAEQVRAVVKAVVNFVDEDRRRGRVLYAEGLGNEALNRRRLEAGDAVVRFVELYAAQRDPGPPADDPIGRVGASILVGGFTHLLVDWLAERVPVEKEELVEDAAAMFLALGDAAGALAARRQGELRAGRGSCSDVQGRRGRRKPREPRRGGPRL